jgi:hypothetical protein
VATHLVASRVVLSCIELVNRFAPAVKQVKTYEIFKNETVPFANLYTALEVTFVSCMCIPVHI